MFRSRQPRFWHLVVLIAIVSLGLITPGPNASAELATAALIGQASSSKPASSSTPLGYGVIVSNLANLNKVQDLQFNWVKLGVSWQSVEGQRGSFDWTSIDDAVSQAYGRGLKILIRVDESPSWASGTTAKNGPPLDDQDLANFMYVLAGRYRGRVKAYEIWNEPNLDVEWGGQYPNPTKYGQMLRALYPRVKQADANAKVVTGGLSNTGEGNGTTVYGDLAYIKNLYASNLGNAKGYFDAIGSHPYGGPNSPEADPWKPPPPTGTYFRRAWQHNQMANVHGGEDKEIWATEFGWLLDPAVEGKSCDFGPHFNRFKLDAATQANYTVRAFQYAQANWPFMGPMILMNLDLSMDSFRSSGCEVVQFYSLLRPDGSPRPVYDALKAMAKPALLPAALSVSATAVNFLIEPGSATTVQRTIQLTNSGDGVLYFSASSDQPWLTVTPASGTVPQTLTLTADGSGLTSPGYKRAIVTINTSGTPLSTLSVPVVLYYGPVSRVYLPSSFRN
ncbi:MAG: cellulase family glycosylhydrolase [Chloroflexi bacterium]|nr:cellulase family glycosylhydrolase [Chloroflexota bacterium]